MFSSNTSQVSAAGDYQIQRSLRFNSADSTNLSRTPASAGNRKTWTWNAWTKRSALASAQFLFGQAASQNSAADIRFASDDTFGIVDESISLVVTSTQVFRDPSALGMLTVAVDTTQATASNRVKLYWNGTQITALNSASYPSQNADTQFNTTNTAVLGMRSGGGTNYFNGYLAEVYFIDGQALTPSSFGENDTDTGVWKPKAYSGSYGTNGFYLNFSDNSNTTAATLGKDYSGNSNNWTPNNFSVTAGAGNDSLVDSPTSYGTDTGVGGTVRGNYCTANPLDKSSDVTLTNGNLDVAGTAGAWRSARTTFGMSSGKWYWEVLCNTIVMSGDRAMLGIMKSEANLGSFVGSDASGWGYYSGDGNKYTNGSASSYGNSYTTGDVIGIAFDADNGELKYYKNGTVQNSGTAAFTGLTSGPYFPAIGMYAGSVSANFGQRPFAYTAPSGYKALCTTNLPTPAIGATSTTRADDYFNVVTFTGTGAAGNAVTVGFQPDFVWAKDRQQTGGYHHILQDAVRGANKVLYSNLTNAETTVSGFSFTSTGFTLGTGIGDLNVNGSPEVAWNWKANGAGSSNTQGTITSTVSANTTSGFSIVTYTGTSANATVGHGLGAAPSMIIIKIRNTTDGWFVYHKDVGNTKYLRLNTTDAAATFNLWQSTSPTSTVFSIATDPTVNGSGNTYVAYCFAPVAGYSAFGSYTGNGSADGPFIYTGFTPKYVLIKRIDIAGTNWRIITINTSYLSANTADAEYDSPPGPVRGVSNGIKISGTGGDINNSGSTFIYAAFAEVPFKYALAK